MPKYNSISVKKTDGGEATVYGTKVLDELIKGLHEHDGKTKKELRKEFKPKFDKIDQAEKDIKKLGEFTRKAIDAMNDLPDGLGIKIAESDHVLTKLVEKLLKEKEGEEEISIGEQLMNKLAEKVKERLKEWISATIEEKLDAKNTTFEEREREKEKEIAELKAELKQALERIEKLEEKNPPRRGLLNRLRRKKSPKKNA